MVIFIGHLLPMDAPAWQCLHLLIFWPWREHYVPHSRIAIAISFLMLLNSASNWRALAIASNVFVLIFMRSTIASNKNFLNLAFCSSSLPILYRWSTTTSLTTWSCYCMSITSFYKSSIFPRITSFLMHIFKAWDFAIVASCKAASLSASKDWILGAIGILLELPALPS